MRKKVLMNKQIRRLCYFSLCILLCTLSGNASAINLESNIEIKLLQRDENPLNTVLSIDVTNASAKDFFNEMKKQTKGKVSFFYLANDLAQMKPITIKENNITIDQLLKKVLAPYANLRYTLNNNVIEIVKQEVKAKIELDIKGKVLDAGSKKPVVGATIIVVGTNNGAISDNDGNFIIKLPSENSKLDISFVGMKPVIYDKPFSAGEDIVINMEIDAMMVDDVVVTGIFNRKKEGFTGSTTKVTNKDITNVTSGNVLKALQMIDPSFKMSASNLSGSNPNALADFNVRGKSNMGNYESTDAVVLRGDYQTRPNQPLFVLDGIIGVDASAITDLDPSQVESITLLKDAAATVIYGSDAANGVVVVETKAPQSGKLRVSYNGNFSLQIPDLRDYNLCNSSEKIRVEELAGFYDNKNDVSMNSYYNEIKNEIARGVNTYWLSQPVETSFGHRHGVNLEGGDNSLRYKIYLGYSSAPGVMKETDNTSKTGKIDLRYRFGKFLISNQLHINYSSGRRTSPYGSFREYTMLNPYYRIYDEKGKISKDLGKKVNSRNSIANPMYNTTFNSKDNVKEFSLLEAFKAEFVPADNLRFSVDFTLGRNDGSVDVFKPAMHTDFLTTTNPAEKGSYRNSNSESYKYELSGSVSYNKRLNDHLISAFARYSISEDSRYNSTLNMKGFPSDKLGEVYLGTMYNSISGDEDISRALGFMFTLNYAYKQKYSVDFSMRIDAASQFGKNNRFAPFWSAGLRWNIEKEKFIKDLNIFDMLALRASYGITGSQDFNSYQSLQMYSYDGLTDYYKSSDVIGAALYGIGNPDLKWQQKDNYNVSLDFSILNNFLSGKVEYYQEYTKNTLLDFSIAPSTGFESMKNNLGKISNKGYEATIRIMPYSNVSKQAYWNISFTGAHNASRIEEISNAMKARNEYTRQYVFDKPLPQYENGYSQSMIWGVQSMGIDPSTGYELFMNRDGSTTYNYNVNEQIPLGDTEPTLQGSISTSFGYKGLGINLATRYSFGGAIYNQTLVDKIENADLYKNVDRRALTERWKTPGDVAKYKALNSDINTTTRPSSRFVMNNNEFMMSSINVSYQMNGTDNKWIKSLGLSSASIALYFEEMFRFSNIEMERGVDYPFAQKISLSLNLTF